MLAVELARCDDFSWVMTVSYEEHIERLLLLMIGGKSIKRDTLAKERILYQRIGVQREILYIAQPDHGNFLLGIIPV